MKKLWKALLKTAGHEFFGSILLQLGVVQVLYNFKTKTK